MSRAGRDEVSDSSSGFTLLETVCVVAVIATISAFALPSPLLRTSRAGLEQLAMRAGGFLKRDRYAALKRGANVTTLLNTKARSIRAGSSRQAIAIPADVLIRADVSEDCQSATGTGGITFYPDGTSCGGVLAFSNLGSNFSVRVSWLTGGVEIVADR